MIGHKVVIGGTNVTKHVQRISTNQTIETDSDPGKITIVLANPGQIYTEKFIPQADEILVELYNYTYRNSPKIFTTFTGKVTDSSADLGEDCTVNGECDIGHFADYLPQEFNLTNKKAKEVLDTVMKTHVPFIPILWNVKENPVIQPVTYGSDWTYQAVLEDIRDKVGAVFYGDEYGNLRYEDPKNIRSFFDLTHYLSNPNQTTSIMGYCTTVEVVAYDAIDESYLGHQTAKHTPISVTKKDEEGLEKYGPIIAPVKVAYDIHDEEEANIVADQVLDYYKLHEDALTKITVEGMAPELQSFVQYNVFEPILGGSGTFIKKAVVVERDIEYSIDGWTCDLTLKPYSEGDEAPSEEDIGTITNTKASRYSPVFGLSAPIEYGGDTFTGLQGRMDDAGNIQYQLTGTTSEGGLAQTGWSSQSAAESWGTSSTDMNNVITWFAT